MKIETEACLVNGKKDVAVAHKVITYEDQGTLVKITRGGICGSDIHYYLDGKVGNNPITNPMILGHEVVGEIVKSDNPELRPGQKIAINPSKPCGTCAYCQSGMSNQCIDMKFFGSAMYRPHIDGGFTTHRLVETFQCKPYDESADEKMVVFAEPFAVGLHAVNQAGDVSGKTVLVSGVGPIGSLLVAALKLKGAKQIYAFDMSENCLQIAQLMGADNLVNISKQSIDEFAADKGFFDISFEVSGAQPSLDTCIQVTKARGTVVQVGMGRELNGFSMMGAIAKEIHLVGTFRFVEEFDEAVQLLSDGAINPEPLLSHEFDFHDLEKAIKTAADKNIASKVQLVF
ncbi:L-idonate 5-dehydrogenase [Celerinatantimonas diazotrophica]|uniref:L-idonate 5-dehydrogenase n=1 Tax=Celerinatantimonas diazotrophica TaxID=412034 RepID=A0A4R1K4X2_9GAMM|nr:L-idonate 5-dehydrogenase [Celerinatantimonas diazotrophica]TCK58987.1 L-idonate 5-dehydrogenase [Celerinatantimonas diazotrophica]CAG9297622.1 L-idonate 5-dehydrogenase (NAD(P)(+)) [Celerinatantimonas diazotrophica]